MGRRKWIGDGSFCYANEDNNTAENFSDVCRRHCSYDVDYLKMDLGIQSVLIVLSLTGNFILLSLFIFKRRAMTRSSIFILNLCCADLCIALFVTLSSSIEKLVLQFSAPEFFCKTFKFLLVAPLYASAFSILAMGIDRYLAVFHPLLNYRWPLRQSLIIIAVVWSLALLFASPQLAFFAVVDIEQCNIRRCIEVYYRYPPAVLTAYITWFCIVSYFVPALALLLIYSLICRKIWSRYAIDRQLRLDSPQASDNKTFCPRRSVVKFNSDVHDAVKTAASRDLLCRERVSVTVTDATSRVSEAHAAEYKAFANRTKLRMLVMTAVIVALFVLWNAPYACSMIWLTLVDTESPIARTPLFMICTTLANANSSFNSWIYICFNRKSVCTCTRRGVGNADANGNNGASLIMHSSFRNSNGLSRTHSRSPGTTGLPTSRSVLSNGSIRHSSYSVKHSITQTTCLARGDQESTPTSSVKSNDRHEQLCATSSL